MIHIRELNLKMICIRIHLEISGSTIYIDDMRCQYPSLISPRRLNKLSVIGLYINRILICVYHLVFVFGNENENNYASQLNVADP